MNTVACPKCGIGLCLVPAQEPSKPRGPITELDIIAHAKKIFPLPLTEEIVAKFAVSDGGDHWRMRSYWFGTDDNGKKNFAQFADGMKQIGGVWVSDREKKLYYFKVPKQ